MPIMKMKPTSAGQRAMVKVVHPELYKGRPEASLVEPQSKTAGRNNLGRITTRHRGGGHKQHYRVVDFRRNKDGIAGLSVLSMTPTAAPILLCSVTPTVSVATLFRPRGSRLALRL